MPDRDCRGTEDAAVESDPGMAKDRKNWNRTEGGTGVIAISLAAPGWNQSRKVAGKPGGGMRTERNASHRMDADTEQSVTGTKTEEGAHGTGRNGGKRVGKPTRAFRGQDRCESIASSRPGTGTHLRVWKGTRMRRLAGRGKVHKIPICQPALPTSSLEDWPAFLPIHLLMIANATRSNVANYCVRDNRRGLIFRLQSYLRGEPIHRIAHL